MCNNSKHRLCGESDELANYMMNKFAQKQYKTRHDCMGKAIHCELGKRLKFDYQIVYAQTRIHLRKQDA